MIASNVRKIQKTLPDGVTLLAVTKTRSPEEINCTIAAGITDIGENRVQELLEKYDGVAPVRWHIIGHLQTNKVKYIVEKVEWIDSLDSVKLAQEIERRCAACGKTMNVLLQINTGSEENKFGVPFDGAEPLLQEILDTCPHLQVRGLMAVAPAAEDPEEVRPLFHRTKELFDRLGQQYNGSGCAFDTLSMGMSHDYGVALSEGATMVRIGTALFGARSYRS